MHFLKLKFLLLVAVLFTFSSFLYSDESVLENNNNDTLQQPTSIPDRYIVNTSGQELPKQTINKKRRIFPKIEYWSAEELELKGNDDNCLFSLPESAKCIITTEYYNSSLHLLKQPKSFSKIEAQKSALKKLLTDCYRKMQAQSIELVKSNDFEERIEKYNERFKYTNKLFSYGPTVYDTSLFQQAYKKYYESYFKAKSWRHIELLGSSDSQYVDSIFRSYKKDPSLSLPVIKTIDTLLAETLIKAIDTISNNTFSQIKTPFGFFLIRVVDTNKKDEVSYKNAQSQLRILSTMDYNQNTDSLLTEKAYNYFKSNKELISNRDTFELVSYLIPMQNISTKDVQKIKDYDPLQITSVNLPDEIRLELVRFYINNKDSVFVAPVSSIYGTWFFKITGIRKSNEYVSFYSLKSKLVKTMSLEDEKIIPKEHIDRYNHDNAFGFLYSQLIENEIRNASKDQLKKLAGENGFIINENDLNNEEKVSQFRGDLIGKKLIKEQDVIGKWLQSISID